MLMSRYGDRRSRKAAVNNALPQDSDLNHYKVVFVGEGGSGKTNLLNRLAFNRFDPSETRTVDHDVITHRFAVAGNMLVLDFWDTAGQERQHSVIRMYYRHALICIAVYDCTDRNSFDRLDWWLEQLVPEEVPAMRMAPPNVIIVGTKSDLVHLRQVRRDEGEAYAASRNAIFAETNAVRGMQADEFLIALGKAVVRVDAYATDVTRRAATEEIAPQDLTAIRHMQPPSVRNLVLREQFLARGDTADLKGSRIIRLQDDIPPLVPGGRRQDLMDDPYHEEPECLC